MINREEILFIAAGMKEKRKILFIMKLKIYI